MKHRLFVLAGLALVVSLTQFACGTSKCGGVGGDGSLFGDDDERCVREAQSSSLQATDASVADSTLPQLDAAPTSDAAPEESAAPSDGRTLDADTASDAGAAGDSAVPDAAATADAGADGSTPQTVDPQPPET